VRVKAAEAAIAEKRQPIAGRAQPEIAGAVAEQFAHRFMWQTLRGRPARKLTIAELGQLAVGAEPEIARAIFGDGTAFRPALGERIGRDESIFETAQTAVRAQPEAPL